MRNITLISTNHKEIGKCNSEELYKIVESINPEVIFEELSGKLFDIIYNANSLNLPPDVITEIKCVKKYLQSHNIKHIPVDIDARYISDEEQNWMFDTFEKYDDYNRIDNEQSLLTAQYGFSFLNSLKSINLQEEMRMLESRILSGSDLDRIVKEDIEAYENPMIQNIYSFCNNHQFNTAIFMCGAAHRKSIIEKIDRSKTEEKVNQTWTIFEG